MRKQMLSTAIALAFTASAALAADVGPLSSGHPAGVHKAQSEDNTVLFIGLGVAAAIGIAVAASSGNDNTPANNNNNNNNNTSPTTT
jgi:hypothetical protein